MLYTQSNDNKSLIGLRLYTCVCAQRVASKCLISVTFFPVDAPSSSPPRPLRRTLSDSDLARRAGPVGAWAGKAAEAATVINVEEAATTATAKDKKKGRRESCWTGTQMYYAFLGRFRRV